MKMKVLEVLKEEVNKPLKGIEEKTNKQTNTKRRT